MIVVLYASTLNVSFMQSLMNVGLDRVATDFSIPLSQANWVVLGYAIVTGTVITMAASLLKRFGIRKVMLASYVAALAGSVLGAVAWCFPAMLAARLVQAIATGLTFPLVNDALLALSPKGKAGVLLSVNSGIIGAGLAFAPLISGLVITYWGLKALFLLPAAFSLAILIAGFLALRDIYGRQAKRIDLLSVVLSLGALGAFMYGLNDVTHQLLPSIGLMVAALVLLALFVVRQRRLADPLLDLRAFKVRAFTVGELLIMLSYMGSVYLSLLAPLYLEGTVGCTPFEAGIMLVIPILCYAALCFASGPILGKKGVWPLIPGGFLVLLAGYVAMYFASSADILIGFLVCVGVSYGGIGLLYPAVKSVDLEVLPPQLASNGSSIHSTLVQVGGSISSALFVGIMSSDVSSTMAAGASKASAYSAGFSHTLLIAIGVIIAALALSLVYVRLVRNWKSHH